jgi:hypothetical protein
VTDIFFKGKAKKASEIYEYPDPALEIDAGGKEYAHQPS